MNVCIKCARKYTPIEMVGEYCKWCFEKKQRRK